MHSRVRCRACVYYGRGAEPEAGVWRALGPLGRSRGSRHRRDSNYGSDCGTGRRLALPAASHTRTASEVRYMSRSFFRVVSLFAGWVHDEREVKEGSGVRIASFACNSDRQRFVCRTVRDACANKHTKKASRRFSGVEAAGAEFGRGLGAARAPGLGALEDPCGGGRRRRRALAAQPPQPAAGDDGWQPPDHHAHDVVSRLSAAGLSMCVSALGSPARSSPVSAGSEHGERFSRKVFVGGLPPDIDEGTYYTRPPLGPPAPLAAPGGLRSRGD
ncbi:hypothetical protein EVAR_6948_1 [Eumeta japonica]|uniref:Uncharacterized protein n=1 Tax=Eumeta variegata TaxID=151549 RepID=A0A4C1TJ37_EUMVA|nr:hypothetical protein EVAR_6948_1 [Eumeta japonica]